MNPVGILGVLFLGVLLIGLATVIVIFLFVPVVKGVGWIFSHIFKFLYGMTADTLRALGALLTAAVFLPLILLNVVIGRWSAASHFGKGLQDELAALGHCCYRVAIGHPARFLLLAPLTEGLERRVPQAMANAPGRDAPRGGKSSRMFDGYTIVGSLPGGGSGGRLYVAEPSPHKRAVFARQGKPDVEQVVIKAFSLDDGSSLPQIIRESRALEAAKKLGLVLEHELTDDRFFYAMEYVPGDPLTAVTHRLHNAAGPEGLDAPRLRNALSHVGDLLATLDRYHRGGLWHKDVKPDNIIVSDGEAHLVDLGLITPLRSAMTLTTHGTEYFRDPEMVRMALRGAKVHEVDGVKFDVYGAGAVLYSVIENSFPAHGGLSSVTKRCPEALRWVIRRSMAELNRRYSSAAEMLADLHAIGEAADPFAVKPKDLPSMRGVAAEDVPAAPAAPHAPTPTPEPDAPAPAETPRVIAAAAGSPAPPDAGQRPRPRLKPKVRVKNWWSGAIEAAGQPAQDADSGDRPEMAPMPRGVVEPMVAAGGATPRLVPTALRAPAREQVAAARKRAHKRRVEARRRFDRRRARQRYSNRPNAGVAIAMLLLVGGVVAAVLALSASGSHVEGAHAGRGVEIVVTSDSGEVQRVVHVARSAHAPADGPRAHALVQRAQRLRDRLAPAPAPPPPAPPLPGALARPIGAVLVIGAHHLPPNSEGGADLREPIHRLQRAGHHVLGLGDDPHAQELIVAAEAARGLAQIDSPQGVRSVAGWLAGEDGLDAVLWIPNETSAPWRLIGRPGASDRLIGTFAQQLDHAAR